MSRIQTIGLSLLATLVATAPLTAQNECANRRDISETLELTPTGRVNIAAGAGSLRITGRPGSAEVRVTGTACASSGSRLEEMRIDATSSGSEAFVETIIPDSESWFGWSDYARIDLVVEVPETATLDVRDGSGSAEITDVRGGLRIDDGSGSLDVANVAGGLQINDGSGSLTVREVDGDIRLVDGSGSVTLEFVRGSVVVEDDGSGSLSIHDVSGDVVVREDGSGSIRVDLVGGDFVVDRDRSGGIRFADVDGSVQIPRRK
ncbi:MAG: hypothetical protein WD737_04320 [Gemmatimonadota bacterium]